MSLDWERGKGSEETSKPVEKTQFLVKTLDLTL